jgi:Family of unknown function (DUF5681)
MTMQFQPGQSGNPAGRPRGARNKATLLAEAMLEGEAQEIMLAAIKKAKEGDPTVLRLCLDRMVPRPRDCAVEFELPKLETAADAMAAMAAIVDAVANGRLTPSQAGEITKIVDSYRHTLEAVDFEARLSQLEQQKPPQGQDDNR